jgi:hypothetical protein
MSKFAQGIFTPKNSSKYVGKKAPKFRSSWELTFMNFCDQHPSIHQWASEAISVKYKDPITGKTKSYIPDFFVTYITKDGKLVSEVIEIKPMKETGMVKSRSARDTAIGLRNQAKWQSCRQYCEQNNIFFRVLTENDMFRKGKK